MYQSVNSVQQQSPFGTSRRSSNDQFSSTFLDQREQIGTALKQLNYRKPQHPTDVYYIRRSPQLLSHYVDQPEEMAKMEELADKKHKLGYKLFKLKNQEKVDMLHQQNSKRSFYNQSDPFYKSPRFQQTHSEVYTTGKHLTIIKPKDHGDMINKDVITSPSNKTKRVMEEERQRIIRKYCNLEKTMYSTKQGDPGHDAEDFQGLSHHKLVRLPAQQIQKAIKQCNYHVPFDGKEYEFEKLDRIQRDLKYSRNLRENVTDVEEFENMTNNLFNKESQRDFTAQLNQSKEQFDIPKFSPLECVHVDEDRVKNFKFSKRYQSRNASPMKGSSKSRTGIEGASQLHRRTGSMQLAAQSVLQSRKSSNALSPLQ